MSENKPKMLNEDLDPINKKIAEQTALRRKCAILHTGKDLGKTALAVAVCWGLNHIGFISDLFFHILAYGFALWAAFKAGVVWGAS